MDEQNQAPQQDPRVAKVEQTKQNTKEVLKAGEEVALTAAGVPAAGAIMNAARSTPIVGNAINKIEDKATEKLAKNPMIGQASNALNESGMLPMAKQALGAATGDPSAAAGNAASNAAANGATNAATNAATNTATNAATNGASDAASKAASNPSSQGGLPGMPGGGNPLKGTGSLGGSGGSNEPPSDGGGGIDTSASANMMKDMQKAGKILKFIAPMMPTILCIVAIFLVVVILMAQVMMIKDKITGAIVGTMEFSQKVVNFISGDGWNTEEEAFFVRLKQAYLNFNGDDGQKLDIPLLAATIHYSKTVDISIYDGEEGEHEDEIGEGQDNYSDTGSGVWGAIVGTHQTWSFYRVADVKLGKMGAIIPGTRGLLGHLVDTYVGLKTVCLSEAPGEWLDFFGELIDFNFSGYEEYKTIYGGDAVAAVTNMISDIFGSANFMFNSINEVIDNLEAFNVQGESYVNWWVMNAFYEMKEMLYFLTGNYDDEHLKNSPLSYYNNLDGSESGKNIVDLVIEALTTPGDARDAEGKCLIYVKVPEFHQKLDYKSYYRYLVNIYIPNTYYFGQKLGKDYQYDDLIVAANEMFDQKYMYEYLVDYLGEDIYGGCGISYSGESTKVDVDPNMIANIYVNVLAYGETSRKSTNVAETVSLKEYVIGVAYREIGASVSDNAEYLKANIIAIKSYTLGRPITMGDGIKQDGDRYYINMRNSTNDQVYCSLTKGCMDAPDGNRKPAPSAELIEYLGKLYDEVVNEFLYSTSEKNFVGSYRDRSSTCANAGATGVCLGQVESKQMGEAGKDYETILGSFYTKNIGIVDISTGELTTGVMECISSGLELGSDGYYVRTKAPVQSDIYFNPPYNSSSNLGQCVWYVKGRACEIIGNSRAEASKKELAMNTMKTMYGNGNQWYKEHLTNVFGSSTDYRQPRAGAIAVYDWTYTDEHGNKYGHSVIVEKVEGNTVYVSQGWNKCGGAYGGASWSCVDFSYGAYTIEQMKNLGSSKYKFIGYVYLLD